MTVAGNKEDLLVLNIDLPCDGMNSFDVFDLYDLLVTPSFDCFSYVDHEVGDRVLSSAGCFTEAAGGNEVITGFDACS